MSELAALIADMVRSGVDPDLIGRTAAAFAEREPAPVRTARQERNRRYYEKRAVASENRLKVSEQDVSGFDAPPSSPSSPTPLSSLSSTPTTHKENPPKGGQKKASRLPSDWTLPDEWRADALTAGLAPQRVDLEAAKMRDWSVNSAKGAKLDWRAAWRNWCREAADRTGIRGSPMQSQPTLSAAFGQLARNMDAADVTTHHPQPSGIVVLDVPFRPRS